jgi:hypothetical protein
MKYLFGFIFISLLSFNLLAQDLTAGFLPNLTLSYKVSEQYKIVHKLESRFPSYNNDDQKFDANFERFDFQNYVERKIGLFSKLSLGYQLRFRTNNRYSHRSIQQFSWVSRFDNYRIGQRLRSDQTFSDDRKPEVRFRYRAGIQIPLQGQQLDEGEYYLSLSDELVWSYRSPNADLENRVVAKVGFYINDKNKIESGLEWRAEEFFLDTGVAHQLWFCFSWYKSL